MLKGTSITLRPVLEADLEELYGFHLDIANRGEYFPCGIISQPTFYKRLHDTGLWSKEEGLLVIIRGKC